MTVFVCVSDTVVLRPQLTGIQRHKGHPSK